MRPICLLALSLFAVLLLAATLALALPGVLREGRLPLADAFFLASSAVTLTGLSPVAVSELSFAGRAILLLVFQAAGILVIACSTALLACAGPSGNRFSPEFTAERWLEREQLQPARLLLAVALSTLLIEAAGALVLYPLLRAQKAPQPLFAAFFLAASALCNAGFSPLPGPGALGRLPAAVALTLSALAVLGGLGFVVLRALFRRLRRGEPLGYHARVVLSGTALLLALGAALYWLFERLSPGAGPVGMSGLQGLFQAASVRTAGLELAARPPVTVASRLLSVALMLIGGGPGSAAGGLKITTVAAVGLLALRGLYPADPVSTRRPRERPSLEAQALAALYLLRAILLLAACALGLAAIETLFNPRSGLAAGSLLFEAVSAFTSTGLSTGTAARLSLPGRAMLSLTMLAGRLGLLVLAARLSWRRRRGQGRVMCRQAEVLLGG